MFKQAVSKVILGNFAVRGLTLYRSTALIRVLLFCESFYNAQVAQSVEQGTENPRVGSSILSLGTISLFLSANTLTR